MRKPFEAMAPYYNDFMASCGLFHDELIRQALSLAGHERLVDIAGGTGHHAAMLAGLCHEVTVVDESARMLAQIPQRDNIVAVQANAHQTGLPDAVFDIALLSDALHHISDHAALFREIYRILRPGGRLLVHDFNPAALRVKLLKLLEHLVFGPLYYRTPLALQQECREAGFTTVSLDRHGWFYLLLAER